ncbi:1967_t:CDS:2 [Gigaspora margarita]|uniref:1967_t:CDS:1 n=1 Tax=Gigaspora margarita TaxID=4874 RepID=A0ABN7UFZ5_GIGMA|nr:1967_t:CDS:2 [Gigaspora margarita]
MSAITTKFVTDHKLTNETSLEELSQYAPKILGLLTTGTLLVDKEKRRQARNRLQKGYEFSKEQAFVLISHERIGQSKSQVTSKEGGDVNICLVSDTTLGGETIKQTAQRIMKDKLSEKDVKAISRTLVETSSDAIIALSCLSRLRRELLPLNASEKIISAILNLEVTRLSNKVQKECSEQRENEGIDFSDHFSLESVKEKLDGQQDIPQLKDPGKLGFTYLSTFLKKDEFISKSGRLLLFSSLHKLGAVFTSVAHGPKNASKANTYASEALRHSPDNHASPSKRYTIVNMRKRGEPYNQARPFCIFDEN